MWTFSYGIRHNPYIHRSVSVRKGPIKIYMGWMMHKIYWVNSHSTIIKSNAQWCNDLDDGKNHIFHTTLWIWFRVIAFLASYLFFPTEGNELWRLLKCCSFVTNWLSTQCQNFFTFSQITGICMFYEKNPLMYLVEQNSFDPESEKF